MPDTPMPNEAAYAALGKIATTFLASHGYTGQAEMQIQLQDDGSHLVLLRLHPPTPTPASRLVLPRH